jgi:ribosomal protein L32
MAGKKLKDVTALVKCSSCGRPKRAHILCPYCVFGMSLVETNTYDTDLCFRDEELLPRYVVVIAEETAQGPNEPELTQLNLRIVN